MDYKVAILIDGGFFISRFKKNNSRAPMISDIQPLIDDLMNKVSALTGTNGKDILFRTFYYDCRPYGNTERQPAPSSVAINFSQTASFRAITQFQRDLKTFPQLALRLGELSFDGWKVDDRRNPTVNPIVDPTATPVTQINWIPDFKQKSVDMKIGLDIAWLSSRKIVDKIILVAGDSDFIAPMKFARKEGALVYIDFMGQRNIKMDLKNMQIL